MDDRGILFTSDVLLAMIIITMAMGITINQFDQLNFQIQDFTGRQSLEKTVNDAADYLVKTSGSPVNWEKSNRNDTLPGLAFMSGIGSTTNYLDPQKVSAIAEHPNLISNLVHTSNYELIIAPADPSISFNPIDISNDANANPHLNASKEVAVANRTVVVLTNQTMLAMNDLMHINPANQGPDNGFIWFQDSNNNANGTTIYGGPGNVSTAQDSASSFYVTQQDLNNFDYYIYVNQNYATQGQPVNTIQYGVTEGDAPFLNNNYTGLDDKGRSQDLSQELGNIATPAWPNLGYPDTGGLNKINGALQTALNYYNANPIPGDTTHNDFKVWISVTSNPNAVLSLSVVQVYKGTAPFQRIPAKLVLKIWE